MSLINTIINLSKYSINTEFMRYMKYAGAFVLPSLHVATILPWSESTVGYTLHLPSLPRRNFCNFMRAVAIFAITNQKYTKSAKNSRPSSKLYHVLAQVMAS